MLQGLALTGVDTETIQDVAVTQNDLGSQNSSASCNEGVDMENEHGMSYQMDMPVGHEKVTTIANPSQNNISTGLKYGNCNLVSPGINLWPSVLDSAAGGWGYLDK